MKKSSENRWLLIECLGIFIVGIFVDLMEWQSPEEYKELVLLK